MDKSIKIGRRGWIGLARMGMVAGLGILAFGFVNDGAVKEQGVEVAAQPAPSISRDSVAASRASSRPQLPVVVPEDVSWEFTDHGLGEDLERWSAEVDARREAERLEEERQKAEAEAARREAEQTARSESRSTAKVEEAPQGSVPDKGSVKEYAAQKVGGGEQWACLEALWEKESNWRWNADNPTSSAYGIPQALPGSKMASAGADWRTNPITQVNWGLSYIEGRYGSPCAAWQHSQAHNWY